MEGLKPAIILQAIKLARTELVALDPVIEQDPDLPSKAGQRLDLRLILAVLQHSHRVPTQKPIIIQQTVKRQCYLAAQGSLQKNGLGHSAPRFLLHHHILLAPQRDLLPGPDAQELGL